MKSFVKAKKILRYRFENTLAMGPAAVIRWLALFTFAIILLASIAISLLRISSDPVSKERWDFPYSIWNLWIRAIDPASVQSDSLWTLRLITLLISLGGIFILSFLIGAITTGMEDKINQLRRGRSNVFESNHTLILGWSPRVIEIITELVMANRSEKNPAIVILADRDKIEVDSEIRRRIPNTFNTKVVFRTGSSLDVGDVAIVNPSQAKSIIILAPDSKEGVDIYTLKTLLAINLHPVQEFGDRTIVSELHDLEVLPLAKSIGGSGSVFIQPDQIISRLMAQTCRQSGLSVVYQDLMNFDGVEIYCATEPRLHGFIYRDALDCFNTSCLLGVINSDGTVVLNPEMDYAIRVDDELIFLADDNSSIVFSGFPPKCGNLHEIIDAPVRLASPEDTLLIGWSAKTSTIIKELDDYVCQGSRVVIVSESSSEVLPLAELRASCRNQQIEYIQARSTDLSALANVSPESFDHIVLLADQGDKGFGDDTSVLITLLHLRNLARQRDCRFNIVSEISDSRNRALVAGHDADDFVVSNKLVSMLLAQLSENSRLFRIFDELFSAHGSEIYLKPVSDYVPIGQQVNFYSLISSAARRGETAIGYRVKAFELDEKNSFGVVLNPKKSQLIEFLEGDSIIVLAES